MARKKKIEIKQYKMLTHTCYRCGFEGEQLFDIDEEIMMTGKRCPRCHTHMPSPQLVIIEEEI